MAGLKLEHIYKVYPNGTKAVNDISLDIKNGEFIVFVGPSGCGKSTTLRMIAGLEDISAGELYIDNNIVNDMEPKDRDIAMVFQNYALYPHMTVYENMAFGLKLRHVEDDVIQQKVLWASEILGIKDYLDRKPKAMSGGQRQRVALGRAILRDPKVMLLDEPLSNLDAKLRTQMRSEIAKLHQKLKTTFIYVTHDQTEAMTLGDRVVVMKKGRIQQVDTPKNLYNYPANKFVASFIGTPQMNFFPVTLKRVEDTVEVHFLDNDKTLFIPYNNLLKVLPQYLNGDSKVTLGIRCENVKITSKDDKDALKVKISHFEELGSESLIYGSLNLDEEAIDSTKGQIIIKTNEIVNLKPEDIIYVKFDMEKTYFFDEESEESILPRIPDYNSCLCKIKDNTILLLDNVIPLPKNLTTPDMDDCELRIPTDCMFFAKDGIKAKVLKIETIQGKRLAHLLIGKRILFSLMKESDDIKEGDEVLLGIDFTKVTLINLQSKAIMFKPLEEYDAFRANFFNYQSVIATEDNPRFVQYRENKIKACRDYMDAKILLENQSYEKKKLSLEGINQQKKEEEALSTYLAVQKENKEKAASIKEETDKALSELKKEFEESKKDAKEKNDAIFLEKKEKEEEEFKQFKENHPDKQSYQRRKEEYHIFKDNYRTDKENAFNRTLNELTLNFESKVASLKATKKRNIKLLEKEIEAAKKNYESSKNPLLNIEKEHLANLKKLNAEKTEAINRAGYVFFFQFDNLHYELLSDIISNKLIQGLSTRVFSKEFKVEIPHDAYKITDKEEGFEAIVDNNLDYGDTFYVRCHYIDKSNIAHNFYFKSEKSYPINTTLYLTFDLTNSKITETDMNIRLY